MFELRWAGFDMSGEEWLAGKRIARICRAYTSGFNMAFMLLQQNAIRSGTAPTTNSRRQHPALAVVTVTRVVVRHYAA